MGEDMESVPVCLFSLEFSIGSVTVAGAGADIFPDPTPEAPC